MGAGSSKVGKAVRLALRGLALLVAIPLTYLLAALAGGLIPANSGWTEPSEGVRIFVETNGVHTWIVVPTVTPYMDWRPLAPAADIRDPSQGGNYLAIGYGNRDFYLNTPAWKDLTVGRALGAAFGNGSTLLHVDHETDPQPSDFERPVMLRPEEYRRLVAVIAARFRRDAVGKTMPLRGRGYGASDIFYEAYGTYNALYTCNSWSGAMLRQAGVRTGIWTPLSQSVMWRF